VGPATLGRFGAEGVVMNRLLALSALLLVLAGCSSGQSASTETPSAAKTAVSGAQSAAQPKAIDALTNQTLVYECPKCGMDYDKAGKCDMDGADLVATQVAYICPADNQPVEHSGKCPRCAANAVVQKTALVSGGTTGN
jgi:protein-arginine kinase activator protein McsA